MNEYRKWVKKTSVFVLLLAVLPFIPFAAFNYYIDPLWTFNHQNEWNDVQMAFDERLQKTNRVTFQKDFSYEALLVGTSRATYIDQHAFEGISVFNYSVSGMLTEEYAPYAEYAREKNGKEFEFIFVELHIKGLDNNKAEVQPPSFYFEQVNTPFYRWKSLFSFDTFQRARENYKYSKVDRYSGPRSYTRDNVARTSIGNDRIVAKVERYLKLSEKVEGSELPNYDENYFKELAAFKKQHPGSTFIPFTEPVMTPRFMALMKQEAYWNAYVGWLRDSVELFGGVYNFMYPNSVTDDVNNYFDVFHFYPEVGIMIAKKISNPSSADVPADFGVYLTEENFSEHIQWVRKQVDEYDMP